MSSSKISAALRSRLDSTTAREVEVIVELVPQPPLPDEPDLPRQEFIARKRSAFATRADAVAGAVREVGGAVLGRAWLTESLHANVPVTGVDRIAGLDTVAVLDVPGEIMQS
jgi:hypothetical protein